MCLGNLLDKNPSLVKQKYKYFITECKILEPLGKIIRYNTIIVKFLPL